MPDLLHFRRAIGDDVNTAGDGSGSIFLGATVGDSLVSRLQGGVGGGVADCPFSIPQREGVPQSVDGTNDYTGQPDL